MNKDLIAVFEYLEREKGIKRDVVIEAIKESLHTAARKGIASTSNISVSIDPKTADISVYCEKEIVETLEDPSHEISLEMAREIDPYCEIGQFIDEEIPAEGLGRIAAQKARQIIMQKLRYAERDVIYEEYRDRVGELVSGTVKRFFRGNNLIVDLGKVEAIMPTRCYPKEEQYQVGDRILALLEEVRETESGGAEVILSRNATDFVKRLLAQEVPEVEDGTVVVERIEREPGYRTKLAVKANDLRVDPVGACVGMRGNRIKNIVRELNNEKIDIVPFSSDKVTLLQNLLDPIEIRKIRISEEEDMIAIIVDDDDYPAVIGKKGMNARLNGRLIQVETIEVKRMSEYLKTMELEREQLAELEDPSLDEKISEIEGINPLLIENLTSEGFDTPRAILKATPQELATVAGINEETADKILEQIRKQRA